MRADKDLDCLLGISPRVSKEYCHFNSPSLQVGMPIIDQATFATDFHASNAWLSFSAATAANVRCASLSVGIEVNAVRSRSIMSVSNVLSRTVVRYKGRKKFGIGGCSRDVRFTQGVQQCIQRRQQSLLQEVI